MIRRYRFRQSEEKQQSVCETERGGEEKRNVNAPATQDAANRWSKNKSQPKRGADQSHAFGAIFFSRDVGDVGLRRGDVSARDAVENSSDKEHEDRRRKAEHEKADAGADDRKQQHGPAAILVRQTSQHRGEDQLHDRIGREEQTDRARRGIESRAFGVERQHRNDDAKADQIDKDCSEDYDER